MYPANHYVSPSVSLSSPVPVHLPVQFLHVFLSMLCSRKNSFLSSSFWLYRPQLLFPANSSQPCLLFEVDLETQQFGSLSPPALVYLFFFSVKLAFLTHCLQEDFWEIPQILRSFFQFVCFCLDNFGPLQLPWPLSNSHRVNFFIFLLWHLSLIVWHVEPKLIGWNSCQGLHARKKAVVC